MDRVVLGRSQHSNLDWPFLELKIQGYTRVYSKVTREKTFDMCCDSSGLPLAVANPHSKSDISKLLVDLYNGKKGGSLGRGEKKPISTAIIAANFSPTDLARYIL